MPNATPKSVLTVTELTRRIKGLLERDFPSVWVEGEISNLRTPGSGHVYFTLKDAQAQMAAVLFRGAAGNVTFKLRDGLAVVASGDVSVYEKQGQYQLIVRQMLPRGVGALQLAFEELKRRLQAEGLFEPARKRPIPVLPQRIGLITSPTGAAIRDFLNIIDRRFPNVHIVINPVRVQGEGAAQEIAAAIDEFNALHASGRIALDVLIVMRGGGSLEDLWAFNEEAVARALARSQIPTISAVGHEIDFTISDFVADLRAPTPSAAAELVVKAKQEFATMLNQYQQRMTKDLRLRVAQMRQQYADLASSYVFRRPVEVVRQYQQQVDDFRHRLHRGTAAAFDGMQSRLESGRGKLKLLSPATMVQDRRRQIASQHQRLETARMRLWQSWTHRFDRARGRLDLLSPRSVLHRGYSITRLASTGQVVRSVTAAQPGTKVSTMVLDGEFESVGSSPPKGT